MTMPTVNYHDLLGLLQMFEKDHRLQKELVHTVRGSSAGHRSSKRGKKVQKNRAVYPKSKQSKKSKVDKSQIEYFFCKKLDH